MALREIVGRSFRLYEEHTDLPSFTASKIRRSYVSTKVAQTLVVLQIVERVSLPLEVSGVLREKVMVPMRKVS